MLNKPSPCLGRITLTCLGQGHLVPQQAHHHPGSLPCWALDLDADSCCCLPSAAVLLGRVGIWPGEFFCGAGFCRAFTVVAAGLSLFMTDPSPPSKKHPRTFWRVRHHPWVKNHCSGAARLASCVQCLLQLQLPQVVSGAQPLSTSGS